METTPIQRTYFELQDLIETNPQNLWIYDKIDELRKLVHKQVIENIKRVYSDRETSDLYEDFVNDANKRIKMERSVLQNEVWVAISIAEINQKVSNAMLSAMKTPNIFKTNNWSEQTKATEQWKVDGEKELSSEEIPESSQEPSQDGDMLERDLKLMENNKEVVLRLIRDQSTTWFSLRSSEDFTKFFIELDWVRICYQSIIKFFLWDKVLQSHDSVLCKHVMLSKVIFPESVVEERRNKFREAIINNGTWFNLENSIDAKNKFTIIIDWKQYRYRALIAIFWPIRKDVKQTSPESFRDLSSSIFWRTWRSYLKNEMEKRWIAQTWLQSPQISEQELSFEDEKDDNNVEQVNDEDELENTEEWDKKDDISRTDNQWENNTKQIAAKKLPPKKSEKETEIDYENNKKMIAKIALDEMWKRPELKVLWFWPETEKWINSFHFEYNWIDLHLRCIAEMIWLLKPNQKWRIPFKKIKENLFEKEFIEQMEKEAEEEIAQMKKESEEERKRMEEEKKAEEYKRVQEEIKRVREENWYVGEIIIKTETDSEAETIEFGEYAELFYKEMEEIWVVIQWDLYSDKKTVLNTLGVVIEYYFESKKENIITTVDEYLKNDLKTIKSMCSQRYKKSDPALKDFYPTKELIETVETEFLIMKEDEIKGRAEKYFDIEEKIIDIKTYCWALLDWVSHSHIEKDFCEYLTDKIEEKFKKSHENDERWIVRQIKEDERKIQEADEEKRKLAEAMEFCEKNKITLEEYNALVFLSEKLERNVWDKGFDKMMKYLMKLMSKNESLREDEFDNEFTPEILEALEVLNIKTQKKEVKDNSNNGPKKKTKKWTTKKETTDSEPKPTVRVVTKETSNLVLWDSIEDNFIVIAKEKWIVVEDSFKKKIQDLCESENLKNKLTLTMKREAFRKPVKRWNSYYYYVNGYPWAFVGKKEWNEIHIVWWQENK